MLVYIIQQSVKLSIVVPWQQVFIEEEVDFERH